MIRLTQTAQVSAKMEEHDEEGQNSLSYVTPDSVVRAQVRALLPPSVQRIRMSAGTHSLQVTVSVNIRVCVVSAV